MHRKFFLHWKCKKKAWGRSWGAGGGCGAAGGICLCVMLHGTLVRRRGRTLAALCTTLALPVQSVATVDAPPRATTLHSGRQRCPVRTLLGTLASRYQPAMPSACSPSAVATQCHCSGPPPVAAQPLHPPLPRPLRLQPAPTQAH